jgi:hypothetical protein
MEVFMLSSFLPLDFNPFYHTEERNQIRVTISPIQKVYRCLNTEKEKN